MNYYIADTHFGHENGMRYDHHSGAPLFSSIEEHDELIIKNINQVVHKNDHLYFLGDLAYKADSAKVKQLLERINCKNLYLIKGNHDKHWLKDKECCALFRGIYDYKQVNDKGRDVILSHCPIMMWAGQHRGSIHLYGHVHNTSEQDDYQEFLYNFNDRLQMRDSDRFKPARAYNVGCMIPYMNYTPRTLNEIIKMQNMEV